MKKQASTAMWTAAALAASLLLGACGGDGDSDDKIDGAKDGAKPSAKSSSPSASSSTSDRKAPDEIKLAKDAKNVFEAAETGDPKKDEVLADNQRRINAIDRVITTGKDVDQVTVYTTGKAAISANEYIRSFVKYGKSWAGVTRYYNQTVKLDGDKVANLTFCADESKAKNKILKTGKLEPNNGGDKNYIFSTLRMVRNKEGVWQATSGSETAGAAKCMS
ncbi:hypothetical protein [Streptomyces sp. 891-h]|uniref:hypothetical protein n=1 Tax=Streptomyces sp. 891-h TaxID=2720714 RepID=UPI001FAB169B|nr:hypothetical protein [Streptomyces sp. 891-h]UNZ19855.1 hypothetical protein HC362_25250 [Streptomyces sp. 891-h]